VDNGCEDPTVCLIGAVDHEGRVWIRHEHYQKDMPISAHAAVIKKMLAPYRARGQEPALLVMDGTNKQLFREYAEHGLYFQSARNVRDSVTPGIHRVQECLLTLNNGLPGLIVNPECERTKHEMPAYRWKQQTDPDKDGWEIPLKSHDHSCDVVRYICMARPSPAKIAARRPGYTTEDLIRQEREEFWRSLREDPGDDQSDPVIGGRW
jgi:hypothetical protein